MMKSILLEYNCTDSKILITPSVTFCENQTTPLSTKFALQIPILLDKYMEYSSYWDTFTALVHDNTYLSDTKTFFYLSSLLKGDVEKRI